MEDDRELYNDLIIDEDQEMNDNQNRTRSTTFNIGNGTNLNSIFGNFEELNMYQRFLQGLKIEYKEYNIKKEKIVIPARYELKKLVGYGSYGSVYAGIDRITNRKIAIKKVNNVFTKQFEFQKRIFREIKLLEFFQHENIISLIDLIIPPPSKTPNTTLTPLQDRYNNFEDIYIVQELMESDLRNILNSSQTLTNDHVKFFLYQILKAIKFIHSASTIHRDLKPENILINSDCTIKIADFGLARGINFENEFNSLMSTPYVATRWYRSPELLLIWNGVTGGIDIWSVGCIFAELLNKKILFPGKNYLHQLDLILNVLGTPDPGDIKGCPKAIKYLQTLPKKRAMELEKVFPKGTDLHALDLLKKMLLFNPLKRITVEEALEHPYFEDLHDVDDEPRSNKFNFQFENLLTKNKNSIDFKKIIFKQILNFAMQRGSNNK